MKAFNAGHFFRQSHRQVPLSLAEFTVHAKGTRGSACGQKCTATATISLSLSLGGSRFVSRRENRGNNQTRRFPRPALLRRGEGGKPSRAIYSHGSALVGRRDSAKRANPAPRMAERKMAGREGGSRSSPRRRSFEAGSFRGLFGGPNVGNAHLVIEHELLVEPLFYDCIMHTCRCRARLKAKGSLGCRSPIVSHNFIRLTIVKTIK